MRRVGIVGFGNLGQYLYNNILNDEKLSKKFQIVFIWNRSVEKIPKEINSNLILKDLTKFHDFKPDIIVEVAHPLITKQYGSEFLKHADYFCGSPTAFADETVEKEMREIAEKYSHGLYLPSGALWGANDIEKMAKLGSLKGLTVTMKKHPSSLKVEPELMKKLKVYAEDDNAKGEFIVYEGPVRDLCPLAPNNVNTMACASLAAFNLGFDKVKAKLIADKSLNAHVITIEVEGPSSEIENKKETFSVDTVRYNPASVGAVTGNATYSSFLGSLIIAEGSETKEQKPGAYVPPHLRNKGSDDSSKKTFNNGNSSGYGQKSNSTNGYGSYGKPKESFFNKPQQSSRWSNKGDTNTGGGSGYSSGGYSSQNRYIEDKEEDLFGSKDTVGINFDKYNDIPVEISGEDCPEPLETFDKCDLHDAVSANVKRSNYSTPTPIQKFSIPAIMKGRDLMACAQTGSGKTAAFLLPTINSMLLHGTSKSPKQYLTYPTCIVMTPTRELALQIHEDAKRFTFKTGIIPQVVYGGDPIKEQMRELNKGCDILVATPGRLIDLLERGKISLAGCRFLILDEADRMLDMGFEPQIRQIVEKEDLPNLKDRQTLMFSATFPKEIQQLAADFLDNYLFLTVGTVGSASTFITQKVEYVEEFDKKEVLLGLLKNSTEEKTLVFVETKRNADELEYFLYKQGLKADSIHGDRTQQERIQSLQAFKSGEVSILVATSVAARGLDIDGVGHVINYDLPSAIDDYVHRIGRTGRKGNDGLATSFYNDKNKNLMKDLCKLLDQAEQEIPSWLAKELDYSRKDHHGHGKSGKKNFNSRDYRNKSSKTYSHNSSGGSSSSGPPRNYYQTQNKQWHQ